MKKTVLAFLSLAAVLSFGSCVQTLERGNSTKEWKDAEMTLSKDTVKVADTGTKDTFDITTEEESVDVTVDYAFKSWIATSISDKTVTVSAVQDNPSLEERTGRILVTAGKGGKTVQKLVTVIQAGADPSKIPFLTPEATTANVGKAKGATASVAFSTNRSGVKATVAGAATSWLEAVIDGNAVKFTTLEANPTTKPRSAEVTLSVESLSAVITVMQEAGDAPIGSLIMTVYNNQGVIFWQDSENPKHVKVVAAKAAKIQWGPAVEIGCNASDITAADANKMVRESDAYKTAAKTDFATKWCEEELGAEWYIPDVTELDALFLVYNGKSRTEATVDNAENITPEEKACRAAFEAVISGIPDGVKLDTKGGAGDSCWSCREASATQAFYYRWGKILYDKNNKVSTARFARCVKDVVLE